jgi:MerR family transcriptional regulator, redox-sensitive transcriptional activator SoxR
MQIGEIAARSGLRPSAIRFYEQIGLLPAPIRESGRRQYDSGALSRLALIRFAQSSGFRLAEVRELFSPKVEERAVSARWKRLASAKLSELNAFIARARAMKRGLELVMQCQCMDVEQCGRAIQWALEGRERPGKRSRALMMSR